MQIQCSNLITKLVLTKHDLEDLAGVYDKSVHRPSYREHVGNYALFVPKVLHNLCFSILQGITVVAREMRQTIGVQTIEDVQMANSHCICPVEFVYCFKAVKQ